MIDHLFTPIELGGISLKNRLTMAPLYLGYAGAGGTVSPLLLEHYRMMADSGVGLVVVENATVDHPTGSGSDRTIRADTDANADGLAKLAETIHAGGARACLQINHAGRFAGAASEPVAPSAVETFGRTPKALSEAEIDAIMDRFADAARRVKAAGFDMVELHGGTGYLLAQLVSPRTNLRTDRFGGALENRARVPLEVLARVRSAVGAFPVGYRFLADEWLPDGLTLDESVPFARMKVRPDQGLAVDAPIETRAPPGTGPCGTANLYALSHGLLIDGAGALWSIGIDPVSRHGGYEIGEA